MLETTNTHRTPGNQNANNNAGVFKINCAISDIIEATAGFFKLFRLKQEPPPLYIKPPNLREAA
jgi:hypothetical protein